MKREQVYKGIKDMFGLVPSMFKSIPDATLELEWLFRLFPIADIVPFFIRRLPSLTERLGPRLKMLFIMPNPVPGGALI